MTQYFATKFDSAAHEVIAILSSVSEGYGKEETGDCESPAGFFALVILDDSCDLDVQDTTNAYPMGDEAGEIARTYGVTAEDIAGNFIVTHNSQGFVRVESFDTAEEASNAYQCRAERYAAWDAAEEEDETREDGEDGPDGLYICGVIGHGYHNAYDW